MANRLQYDTEALAVLFEQRGRMSTYKKGEFITRPFANSSNVTFIVEGYVRAFATNDRGEEHTHIIYKAGEMFPLLWIIGESNYEVYDMALTDCVIRQMAKEDLLRAVQADIALCQAMLAQAAERTRLYVARVNNLEHKYARERLICRLMIMASRFGERRKDGSIVILPPITQQLLASSINLARESVSREMERLEQLGQITHEDHRLVLKRPRELAREFKEPVHPDWWGLSDLLD